MSHTTLLGKSDSRLECRVTWNDGHSMPVEFEHAESLIAWRKLAIGVNVRSVEVRDVSPWRTARIVLICPECGRDIEAGEHEGRKHGWAYCESSKTWVAPPGYGGEGRSNPCLPMRVEVRP